MGVDYALMVFMRNLRARHYPQHGSRFTGEPAYFKHVVGAAEALMEAVGTTARGTRLSINREVMSADLKIAIGCVTAHPQVGFSGGGVLG